MKLKSYLCPAGVLTIGYGHTGKDVYEGMVISWKKAEEFLVEELKTAYSFVDSYINVHLDENQRAALASFTLNLGQKRLSESTLRRRLN